MTDAFDSELCDVMSRALTKALNHVKAENAETDDQAAKAALTRGIVEAALHGERDEIKLAARALSHLRETSMESGDPRRSQQMLRQFT